MTRIHSSVTLLTSRDLTWNSVTRQHASHISVVAHMWCYYPHHIT